MRVEIGKMKNEFFIGHLQGKQPLETERSKVSHKQPKKHGYILAILKRGVNNY
jgi:hypothetical protein